MLFLNSSFFLTIGLLSSDSEGLIFNNKFLFYTQLIIF